MNFFKGMFLGLSLCVTFSGSVNGFDLNKENDYKGFVSLAAELSDNETTETSVPKAVDKDYTAANGIKYHLFENGNARVLGILKDKSAQAVTIPETVTVDGYVYTVRGIGEGAFESCSKIKSINIPNTVTVIGKNAFKNCKGLGKVTLPSGLVSLGSSAFWGSDVSEVVISGSLKYVPSSAFRNCTKLKKVVLGGCVASVKACAFYNCVSLSSVEIGKSVQKIEKYAFAGDKKIKKTVAKKVKNTAKNAFYVEVSISSKTGEKYNFNKMVDKKGDIRFVGEKGNVLKSQFVKWGKETYYVQKNGIAAKGWCKVGSKYYCLNRDSGKLYKSTTVDEIKVDKTGAAKNTSYNIEKIKVMMQAREIMLSVTKSTDSKSEKLEKCFKWIFPFPYHRYRILAVAKSEGDNWDLKYAKDVFNDHQGCCVSYASAFAYLAKECGYNDVYICDDTSHSWTEIGGRVYDPLFAEAKNYKLYFNGVYKTAKLCKVGAKKI